MQVQQKMVLPPLTGHLCVWSYISGSFLSYIMYRNKATQSPLIFTEFDKKYLRKKQKTLRDIFSLTPLG